MTPIRAPTRSGATAGTPTSAPVGPADGRRQHRFQRRRRVQRSELPNNPTDVWVGDYTIQPENGGLGVFAHEYGHDLGLPDLYDTSGNTGGAENSTAFWTLMSSGANIGDGGPDGIGDNPDRPLARGSCSPLGWLGPQGTKGPFYEVAQAGTASRRTSWVRTSLPRSRRRRSSRPARTRRSRSSWAHPATGATFFYSGSGDDLNNTMTRTVGGRHRRSPPRSATRSRTDWDYAFLEASTDGGSTGARRDQPVGLRGDQSGFNTSGPASPERTTDWTDLTATLPAGTTRSASATRPTAPWSSPASRSTRSQSVTISRSTTAGSSTASARRPAARSRRSSTPTSSRTASTTGTTSR